MSKRLWLLAAMLAIAAIAAPAVSAATPQHAVQQVAATFAEDTDQPLTESSATLMEVAVNRNNDAVALIFEVAPAETANTTQAVDQANDTTANAPPTATMSAAQANSAQVDYFAAMAPSEVTARNGVMIVGAFADASGLNAATQCATS
ncbi:MAG: hypothetical protein WCW16_02390 [Candidatus Magasanikbacteria bacterium]